VVGDKPLFASERPGLLATARQLRKAPTPAEATIWSLLRGKQLSRLKFRRQHAVEGYIVDFYCHEKRLCVELDGEVHLGADKVARDSERDGYLRLRGYKILRIQNQEALGDPEAFRSKILKNCQ
jgi:very-short-patch-repair endonuclease